MGLLKIICWALIFLTRLHFPPGSSIASILKDFFIKKERVLCSIILIPSMMNEQDNLAEILSGFSFIQQSIPSTPKSCGMFVHRFTMSRLVMIISTGTLRGNLLRYSKPSLKWLLTWITKGLIRMPINLLR